MSITFADIRNMRPNRPGAYLPDERMPKESELIAIEAEYGVTFPPSYKAFQLRESRTTPIGGRGWEGFGWANRELEPALSLDSVLSGAKQIGIPAHLSAFREDECNYYCFDTTRTASDGEFPVVFWCHDERDVLDAPHLRWENFMEWLAWTLADDNPES